MTKKMITTGIVVLGIVCFYALQYVSTAIHVACLNPAEDCPPPINIAGEIVYRVLVQPPWLDNFYTK
jgi:hypothetical protein